MTKLCIIGAGAAGIFASIIAKCENPTLDVTIFEKTQKSLSKVKISGGGRCNVTHACFDPKVLIQNYPRGNKALLSIFSRFQPKDTIDWFSQHGVTLKTERDGRMFPTTDSSETIITALLDAAKKNGVEIVYGAGVKNIETKDQGFRLFFASKDSVECDKLLVTTGSNRALFTILETLGHTIEPLVPSLFTFNIKSHPLKALSGVAVSKAKVKLAGFKKETVGPLLITHWGFSGPAVLKLSSFAARYLHDVGYKNDVSIDWLPDLTENEMIQALTNSNKKPFDLPKSLWHYFLEKVEITQSQDEISKKKKLQLVQAIKHNSYTIEGQTTNKEEFVTCGGVSLRDVNCKTMESKRSPGLFFAGEVLDIDGVTGGFNFQNAWSTAYIAANEIAKSSL